MSSKPLSFHDLPTEVRNLIYRQVVICDEKQIEPENQSGATCRPEISQATEFLKVSKVINIEASPVFYANHQFLFDNISSVITFVLTIGKQNASHITVLSLGSMSYTNRQDYKFACCEKNALMKTARNLGSLCSGLELLDFEPAASSTPRCGTIDDAPFTFWTINAFAAVKALTVAFPWLNYVSYDHGDGGHSVRMTSIEAMQISGEVRPARHNFGGAKLTNVPRIYPSISMLRL